VTGSAQRDGALTPILTSGVSVALADLRIRRESTVELFRVVVLA
jgi:hypothetical protein